MGANPPASTVIITGATGNLGRAVADAFDKRGANLVLIGHHRDALASAFGSETPRRLFAPADLLDRAQVGAAARLTLERFGRIDVLCNIAGGFRMGSGVHEISDADWNFLFDINVRTMINAVRSVVPHMISAGGGRIVNVGAHAALRGVAQMGAYCAAKSAVIRLTESMAAEVQGKAINVNCVLPTTLDTPENRAAMPGVDPARWVSLDDAAKLFVFLASDEARALHGAAISVSGTSA
jgi:NAD(P)-dependent dehydrogenase (short-subunit alcohol dehydrogenase family)